MYGALDNSQSNHDNGAPPELGSAPSAPTKSQGAWYQPLQPINSESMFLLQLHPVFRCVMGSVYGIFGYLLVHVSSKHMRHQCGKDIATLDTVIGCTLALGSVVYFVGAMQRFLQTVAGHGEQWDSAGDPLPPRWQLVMLDWLITVTACFVQWGILNSWYWGFAAAAGSGCPDELKNVTLAFLIFVYVLIGLFCLSVPIVAYHISGPSYAYQDEQLELDLPKSLRQRNYDSLGINRAAGKMVGT